MISATKPPKHSCLISSSIDSNFPAAVFFTYRSKKSSARLSERYQLSASDRSTVPDKDCCAFCINVPSDLFPTNLNLPHCTYRRKQEVRPPVLLKETRQISVIKGRLPERKQSNTNGSTVFSSYKAPCGAVLLTSFNKEEIMQQKPARKKIINLPGRYLLIGGALVMLLLGSEVSAKVSTDDIHNVSEICMNVQRVLKDYALIGMKTSFHDHLQEDLAEIDEHINDIKAIDDLDKKKAAEILEIEKIWTAAKPKFQKKPFNKKTMHELHEVIDEELTERCEKIINEMSADTGIKGHEHVVHIGQLGVESQRLAAVYLLKAWGIDDPHYAKVVQHTLDEINQIYEKLMSADKEVVSTEIKEELKESKKKFIAFGFMAKRKSGHFMPAEAAKIADDIYEMLREILSMQRTLVEKNASYFIPVTDKKNADTTLRIITDFVYVHEEVRS
ncbi:MAG: hypothetical protein D3917_13025 [Candidatus Electrothrix sp. AX5]|nr:hypothetical protein [Candidatus Electrothrix sp. AX5]